jgi:outer membrane protein assembly factor BamD
MKILSVILLSIFLFNNCAVKVEEEYNKPAIYWYNKMLKEINMFQVEKADETYVSLESEHRNSPLLPSAIIIIAKAHMDNEDYTMANYYYDEYLKRFAKKSAREYINYLKVKAKFLSFKTQFRDQELLYNTILDTEDFLKAYPSSKYKYLIETMRSRLFMAKAYLDKEIAELYERKEKNKAYEYYMSKAKESWEDLENIEPVDAPFYRSVFE